MSRITELRKNKWAQIRGTVFDCTVIGGGINGAAIYHALCRRGYKTLLIDKGDFSGATSQASAMMVWGGLLYLHHLDVRNVIRFSRARDKMIADMSDRVSARSFRFVLSGNGGRPKWFMQTGLWLYWLMGSGKRNSPHKENTFQEQSLLKSNSCRGSLLYEEAVIKDSDSRFVLHWIAGSPAEDQVAVNYCTVMGGEYNRPDSLWHLDLADQLEQNQLTARARMVINCAGVWADRVNNLFHIRSPYKHVLSKGVFLGFKRPPEHRLPMIFETHCNGDVLMSLPWGPVSLWGPTETRIDEPEQGYTVTHADIEYLLEHRNADLKPEAQESDILSFRCGVRPLAVKQSYNKHEYPLALSRKSVIQEDLTRPWITVYGGKLTGCKPLADKVADKIFKQIPVKSKMEAAKPAPVEKEITWHSFPGLPEPVPSLEGCIENEYCCTLEDYLRRRTNISQWIAREGLGRNNENWAHLFNLALKLTGNNPKRAKMLMNQYGQGVEERFDRLVARKISPEINSAKNQVQDSRIHTLLSENSPLRPSPSRERTGEGVGFQD